MANIDLSDLSAANQRALKAAINGERLTVSSGNDLICTFTVNADANHEDSSGSLGKILEDIDRSVHFCYDDVCNCDCSWCKDP